MAEALTTKFLTLLLLAVITSVTALAQNGPDLLQKALRKERVEGDLKGAIELYQQIVKEHAGNRSLAAQALVQMGKGYEKLGVGEARSAYDKVISEYADQTKEVAEARERLKSLDGQAHADDGSRQPVVRLVASDKIDPWVALGDAKPSPNGKYLSYVNWEHGNLAFHNIETGELRDLTTEGTWSGNPNQFSWEAIWSPDSTQVAYLWNMGEKGELRMVQRDGGKPKVLVPAKLWPQSWSKDGKQILALGPYRKAWPNRSEKLDGILLVDAVTGKTNMVKQLSDTDDSVTASLSPDGKFIAYSYPRREQGSTNSAQSEIRIVNIDGSNDRSLIEHPANDVTPRWMPDGNHLLFVSDRSGNRAIWMQPTRQGQKAGEPRMIRDDLTGRLLGTTDNGTVFHSARSPSFNIYVAEVDFDAATMGTPRLVSLRYDGKNRNPRWSSDGSRLGYLSWRKPAVLVFQDAATGQEQDVKTEWGFGQRPVWSPNLSRLVGAAKSPTQKGKSLFQVDVKSGRRTILESLAEPDDDVANPLFTPDGKHLIYSKFSWTEGNPPDGLVELDLETRQERRISRELASYNRTVAVSPDGTHLAMCSNPYPIKDGDVVKLLVASRTDGATKTAAEFPISEKGRGQVCDWLPDNRRVIVAFEGKQSQELYLVDTETGSSRPFGPPQPKGESISSLSIHPDGKRVAFERGRVIQEIWTMKNILPDEKHVAK